jgi:hypothetical protein
MRKKTLFICLFSFILVLPAAGETTGYLSFEYTKGQMQSYVEKGTFQNSQLGLNFFGELSPRIVYHAELLFRGDATVDIDQAWIGLTASNSFRVKLGLFLIPFGQYNIYNRPHQTFLVNPPLNVDHLYPKKWKDLGVQLEGQISSFLYSVYLSNGLSEAEDLRSSHQWKDNNADKATGFRVSFMPDQGFEVGYSYYIGKFDDDNSRSLKMRNIDVVGSLAGLMIRAEYTIARIENPDIYEEGRGEGYYIQASFVWDNFRPVVSYQKLDYSDEFHGSGFLSLEQPGEGILLEKERWTMGLVYLPSQNVFIKIEYSLNKETENQIKDNVFSAQVALSF